MLTCQRFGMSMSHLSAFGPTLASQMLYGSLLKQILGFAGGANEGSAGGSKRSFLGGCRPLHFWTMYRNRLKKVLKEVLKKVLKEVLKKVLKKALKKACPGSKWCQSWSKRWKVWQWHAKTLTGEHCWSKSLPKLVQTIRGVTFSEKSMLKRWEVWPWHAKIEKSWDLFWKNRGPPIDFAHFWSQVKIGGARPTINRLWVGRGDLYGFAVPSLYL